MPEGVGKRMKEKKKMNGREENQPKDKKKERIYGRTGKRKKKGDERGCHKGGRRSGLYVSVGKGQTAVQSN